MNQKQINTLRQRLRNANKRCDKLFKDLEIAEIKANESEDAVADLQDRIYTRIDHAVRVLAARKVKQINQEITVPTKRGDVYKYAIVTEDGIYDAAYALINGQIQLNTAISRGCKTVWKVVGSTRCYQTKSDAINRVNPITTL